MILLLASSKQSYLYLLLKVFALSQSSATRATLASLLEHALANSILFQEDPHEPAIWLACIPVTRRASAGAEAPDGAPLTDELESVLSFLDDCVQRCLKTPYRYIEEMQTLVPAISSSSPYSDTSAVQFPSPLLMTVVEQFGARVANRLASPSDVLAIATFLRKLLLKLSTQLQDQLFLIAVLKRVNEVLTSDDIFPQYPNVSAAIRRETETARICLGMQEPSAAHVGSAGEEILHFINEVEKMSFREYPHVELLVLF